MKDKILGCFEVVKKNKFMVLGIILIPFLYAILYVNAFWDPVNKLENMRIAVINMDEGTEYDGEEVNYGDTIMDRITDDDTVQWTREEPSTFANGIENTDYNMAFVIDKDFSKDVMAAADGDPIQGEITYVVDKRKNFILSQYGNMIRSTFQTEVSQAISKEYTETIYGGLQKMADSLSEAADGSSQLDSGANTAADGVGKLKSGADTLAGGLGTLSDNLNSVNSKLPELESNVGTISSGISSAHTGSSVISNGLDSLGGSVSTLAGVAEDINAGLSSASGMIPELSGNISALSGGLDSLADAASGAASAASAAGSADALIDQAISAIEAGEYDTAISALSGAKSYTSAAAGAASTMGGISSKLSAMSDQVSGVAEEVDGFSANVDKMASGAAILSGGLAKVSSGVSGLSGVSGQVESGLSAMSSGMPRLQGAISTLSSGSSQMASGASKLQSGANQLAAGLGTLETGMFTLAEGTDTLATAMNEGYDELSGSTKASTEDMADFVSNPTNTDEASYGDADTYGMGFSPFFISLSAWLGAVLLFFVVPVRPPHAKRATRTEMIFGPMPAFAAISLLQGIFIAVGTLIVGVNVNNVPLLFLMTMLMSFSFALFIQFLNVAFGLPGRGFSIIILIFQLCACGGTFPVELIGGFFRKISPFMPFTYSVKALKEIMFGSELSIIAANAAVIIGFGVVSLILSLLCYKKGMKFDEAATVEA